MIPTRKPRGTPASSAGSEARATPASLIAAEGLSVDLGGRRVLDRSDLAVAAGEIVTLVGPNGSGKSTLLRAMIGALAPSAGRIARAEGLTIGYVPQRLALDGALPITVGRFLALPRRRLRRGTVEAALAEAGVPGLAGRSMAALSGGQLQRVLLARALVGRPDLLMLDEPTQGLDQPGEAAFYERLARVRAERGCAVLLVSHDLHVVMAASDRVVCLNGHVCCEGTPATVSSAPAYRALFGAHTRGALALYAHEHDHHHDAPHDAA
ncbi:MAG: metal ABC transporter ATP-binding protein [Paracoccaceae bacterium]